MRRFALLNGPNRIFMSIHMLRRICFLLAAIIGSAYLLNAQLAQYQLIYTSTAINGFNALEPDGNNGLISVGYTNEGGTFDMLVMRNDQDANVTLLQRYDFGGEDTAFSIVPMSNGTFTIVGNSVNGGTTEVIAFNISQTGTVNWTYRYDNFFLGKDPVLDDLEDEIVIVGWGLDDNGCTGSGCRDLAVIRLDNTGNEIFNVQHNLSQDGLDQGNAVTYLGSGSPLATLVVVGEGNFTGIVGVAGCIALLDANTGAITGNPRAIRNPGGTGLRFTSVASTNDAATPNNVIIAGRTSTFAAVEEGWIMNYNTSTNLSQGSSTYALASNDARAVRVRYDSPGTYITANAANTTGVGQSLHLVRFDLTGGAFSLDGESVINDAANPNFTGVSINPVDGAPVVAWGVNTSPTTQDAYVGDFNTTLGTSCNDDNATITLSAQPPVIVSIAAAVATPVPGTVTSAGPSSNNLVGNVQNPCCIGYNLTFNHTPVCEGDNTTITPNITVPANTDFQWYIGQAPPPTGTPDQEGLGPYVDLLPAGFNDFTLIAVDSLTGCTDTVYDSVQVVAPPIAQAPADAEICIGDTISLDGIAGSANVNWSVVTGDFGSIGSPNTEDTEVYPDNAPNATTYRITVTDPVVAGCSNSDDVIITVNPLPAVDAGPDVTICVGDNATLTATGANTYIWSPNIGLSSTAGATVIASPSNTVSYEVIGTDNNGCINNDSITVAVVNATLSTSGDTAYCTNTSGTTLDATIQGATVACTYTWSPNVGIVGGTVNDPSIIVAPAATQNYDITINCGGGACVENASINVIPNAPPVADAGSDTTICAGDTINLSGSGSDLYQWAPAGEIIGATDQQTILISPVAAVDFEMIATDAVTGCSDTDSVSVNVNPIPVFTLGPDATECEGELLAGFSAPAGFPSYAWTPDTALQDPTQADQPDPILRPVENTEYTATVTDAAGCSYTDTLNITVTSTPQAFINGEFVSDTVVCKNDSIVLVGSGGDAYTWLIPGNNTSGGQVTLEFNDTTQVRLIASANGCPGTIGDTASIVLNIVEEPDVSFFAPVDGCVDEPVLMYWTGDFLPDSINSVDSLVWDFDTACVVNFVSMQGMLLDSVEVTYCDSGLKFPGLSNITEFCSRGPFERQILIRETPIISAGNDIEICQNVGGTLNGSFVFQDTTASCAIEWLPYDGLSNPFTLNPIANPTTDQTYYLQANCSGCLSNIDSVTVTVNEVPVASIDTFLLEFCDGTGGVQLPGDASGGSGLYNPIWTPTSTVFPSNTLTPQANPTTDTQYELVVQDQISGCFSNPAFIQVNVLPQPIAFAGDDKNICQGTNQGVTLDGQISQNGFGLTEVTWSPAATLSDPNSLTPFATPQTTTTYSLYVINQYSLCDNSATITDDSSTVTVFVNPTPVADAGADSAFICLGGNAQLGGSPSGGGPNYTYEWSPAIGLSASDVQFPQASPAQTTTYFLKVISNGCTSVADSIVVDVRDAPYVAAAFPYVRICEDNSVIIGTDPKPGLTYSWSPTAGLNEPDIANPSAAPDLTTTYTLSVNTNGCTDIATDTVRVEVVPSPEPILPEDFYVVCPDQQDSIQLIVNGVDTDETPILYSWSPNIAISDTMAQSPFVLPKQSTTYKLTVFAGQCEDSAEVEVFVNPPINAQISLEEGVDTAVCEFEEVRLTASGGVGAAIFRWLDNGSLNPIRDVQPQQTTTYEVEVRESGICRDTASITLEVFPQVIADYDFTYNIGCDAADEDGMTVAFRATDLNASFFSWDFGDGSPVSNDREPVHVYNVPEGESRQYTVRLYVAGVAACDQTVIEQDLVVTNQRPEARFISVPETQANLFIPQANVQFQNNSTGAVNYFWRFGDGQVSTEENPVHAYERAGSYDVKLTVTDANGCTDVYTDGPYVVAAEELALPSVFTPNEDGVNDRWLVGYTGTKPYEVKILSRQGQLVYSATDMNDQGWDGTLDNGEEAPEGVYFYVADIEGKIYKGNFMLLR